MDAIHVYPVNDLLEHDLEASGIDCACLPNIEQRENSLLVIHNSWDGREITERALDHAFNEGKN